MSFKECRHVLASGQKCKGPALRHSRFCYFHRNQRDKRDAPPPRQGTRFVLPVLEDDHSLLNAVNAVCAAMGEGQIKRSEATTYLAAVNIASRVIARIALADIDPVRALEYDNDCAELAPEMTGCDPVHDCYECPRQDVCEVFEKAKEEPKKAPIAWRKLIAKQQRMSTREMFAGYNVRADQRLQRLKELHGLAVAEDQLEDPNAADYILPPRKKPPQPETNPQTTPEARTESSQA